MTLRIGKHTKRTIHDTQIVLYYVIMKLVILLWILPVTFGDISVTCIYSEECMLPCTSTNLDIIHWYKDSKPVHSFYHNKDQLGHQSDEYKGRTSLFPESEIKKGNISLLLKNIRVQDEGRYRCYAADDVKNDEKFVSLSVEAPVKSVDITLKDDTVICTTSGVYPKPQVLWSSDPPAEEPSNTFQQTEDKLFNVASELKVGDSSNAYKYTCSITTKDRTKTATLENQAVLELTENEEFVFKCPIPMDVHYTLILKFSTTILTYDSKTSSQDISEQWKDKVTFHPENGDVKLSHLNKEQLGTYTCESTSTDKDRYIAQASVSSGGLGIGVYISIGIIAVIVVVAIVIFVKRKNLLKKLCTARNTDEPCHEPETAVLQGGPSN